MEGKKLKEKKLTDEEIIKAYEHCYVNDGTCKSCCLTEEDKLCVSHQDVLDLINRQKAEIKRLTEWKDKLQDTKDELEQQIIDTGFKEYCEENKRLTDENAELKKQVDELNEYCKDVYKKAVDREEDAYSLGFDKGREQAVKDTAKEIFEWLEKHCFFNGFEIVETYFKERYGVEVK